MKRYLISNLPIRSRVISIPAMESAWLELPATIRGRIMNVASGETIYRTSLVEGYSITNQDADFVLVGAFFVLRPTTILERLDNRISKDSEKLVSWEGGRRNWVYENQSITTGHPSRAPAA